MKAAAPTTQPRTARTVVAGILLLTSVQGDWSSAVAQPRITIQPRNVAVLLDQNAQFRVSASGTPPLSYQWRFNGTALEQATSSVLTVTNITLAQLGGYEVTVSNSAGAVVSAPAWLLLATRWSELVYFGSSEGMQMCDGAPWNDQLAGRLGVSLRSYAAGNVNSSGVASQITTYLASHTPTTNTLVAFWSGGSGNDMLSGASPESAASNRVENVRRLAVAGARDFLILRFFPPELSPFLHTVAPNVTNGTALRYDALLDDGLQKLNTQYALTVFRPDMFAFFTAVWSDPKAYGFQKPLGTDFWCDGFHLTLAAHRVVSQKCYRWITPPVSVTLRTDGSAGLMDLQWQGGSSPFRVQRCEELVGNLWQTEQLTFQTNTTLMPSAEQEFFRVITLGQ